MTTPPGPSTNFPAGGLLLVVSGPSGSGKTTLVDAILKSGEFPISFSVSATSRPPRPGEIEQNKYQFLSPEEFQSAVARDEFLEYAEVHGNFYGTPRQPVDAALREGRWVLLEIDVQGHRQVRRLMPDAVSVFIRSPSADEYEQRLRARGTETEATIARRNADARRELAEAVNYDYQIVNESVDQAVRTFRALLWGAAVLRGIRNA